MFVRSRVDCSRSLCFMSLTGVCGQVHLACVGLLLCSHLRVPLAPPAVIHEVGLQVPLTPEPDPTGFTQEYVLYKRTKTGTV